MSNLATALPGQATLLASWGALARLSPRARLVHGADSVAAVFPAFAPFNNAIMLTTQEGAAAAASAHWADVYAGAGVDTWALWLPSRGTDFGAADEVHAVGALERDTTTLVMETALRREFRPHAGVVRTSIAAAIRATDEAVPASELGAPDEVPGLAAWVMVHDDAAVAGAWTFVHDRDCGIYAVGTVPAWRRRGLARSLVEHALADAVGRGARTATLQSTAMGRPLYESLGFAPAGRYEEWISQ